MRKYIVNGFSLQRKEIIKMCEEMNKLKIKHEDLSDTDIRLGYNQALTDLINKLK